jgi:hypothetical protein
MIYLRKFLTKLGDEKSPQISFSVGDKIRWISSTGERTKYTIKAIGYRIDRWQFEVLYEPSKSTWCDVYRLSNGQIRWDKVEQEKTSKSFQPYPSPKKKSEDMPCIPCRANPARNCDCLGRKLKPVTEMDLATLMVYRKDWDTITYEGNQAYLYKSEVVIYSVDEKNWKCLQYPGLWTELSTAVGVVETLNYPLLWM